MLNSQNDSIKIDQFVEFCENLLNIQNNCILKLYFYSRYYAQEELGEPYCKYLLIFQYSESSVETEMIHLQKSNKFFKKSEMKKLFETLGRALDYFHTKGQVHGDLRTVKVMKIEDGSYRLMPPKIKQRKKNEFYTYAPEQYEQKNFRNAFEKQDINLFKAEIFSLGLLLLEIGTFQPSQELYGKFDMLSKRELLEQRVLLFQTMYGFHLGQILFKCFDPDPNRRIDANDFLLLLSSQELTEQEKIWNQNQKHLLREQFNLQKSFSNASVSPSNAQTTSKNFQQSHQKSRFQQLKSNSKSTVGIGNTSSHDLSNKNKKQIPAVGKILNVVKYWEKEFGDDVDDKEDQSQMIFETLPQEFQEEIDSIVSEKIKEVEQTHDIQYIENGHRYQGFAMDGQPHGWGTFWWANGEMYEGQFVNGKQNGHGIYYWPNGDKYYGEFLNGQINGLGVRFYERGINEYRKRTIDCYFGEWLKGQNHGKGTFYWQDKAKFKGHFFQDIIYGKGTLIIPDDDEQGEERYYEGLWKDESGQGISVEKVSTEAGIHLGNIEVSKKTHLPTKKNKWKQISKIPQIPYIKSL